MKKQYRLLKQSPNHPETWKTSHEYEIDEDDDLIHNVSLGEVISIYGDILSWDTYWERIKNK